MNRIENFNAAVAHKTPSELVLDLGGCPLSSLEGQTQTKLLRLLGYPLPPPARHLFGKVQRLEEALLVYLDIDTRSVGEILRPQRSQFQMLDENHYVDEWGIKRKYTGMYWDIVEHPLRDADLDDLDSYQFPDGDTLDMGRIEAMAAQAKALYEGGEYVVCAEHPVYGVFELGCWLCGFDEFLARLIVDQAFVEKLFDKILAYQMKVIAAYYGALGPYVHYTSSGDDFAMQNNLFMSPELFRKLVKPVFAQRIAYTKKFTRAKYLHHSCGNISGLIPDLCEAGVDILNPIQPCCEQMSPKSLKAKYGDKMVFHGGIDTQSLLPYGSADGIEAGVREGLESLNQQGGYIFAAAHNLQDDVPPQNIICMFQAARKYGKAPD